MGIDKIISFFKTNKVKITKLNHSLDQSTQNATQYDGYLALQNEDEFVIFLKKPKGENQYILEADPHLIKDQQ